MPWMPSGTDPWSIPQKDPDRHYRFLSSKPERLGGWLRSWGDRPGYALVRGATVDDTKAMAVKLGLSAELVDVNLNRIMYGHNVLASIPKEEYERRMNEMAGETTDRIGAAKEAFHAAGADLPGIKTFERDPEEHADRKRIATRDDKPFVGQAGTGKSPHLKPRRTRAVPR